MLRRVQWWTFATIAFGALVAVAGCTHSWFGMREAWRRDAEVACLNSGAVRETPERVRISAINGPGMCGADYPFRVSALGVSGPLGYDDEPLRPPGAVPDGAMPRRWPGSQPTAPSPPPSIPLPQAAPPQRIGQPLSLTPPGLSQRPSEDEADFQPRLPRPYDSQPPVPQSAAPPPTYLPRPEPVAPRFDETPTLGPARGPGVTASAGQVEVKPPATLACPIVSALDQWITAAVQPAALHWFRRPVVEIKQISAYSCRGMNGNAWARISEHAFGNALDISEFVLADGHRITVQYGWRGSPRSKDFCTTSSWRPARNSQPCSHRAPTSIITITFTSI